MATKYPIIENAKRQARMIFSGMARTVLVEIPDSRVIDGVDYVYGVTDHKRYLVTEKVEKFNRKALRQSSPSVGTKHDPRMVGGEDTMIEKVGKPGSRERVEALRVQYESIDACGEEVSPFGWEG